MIHIAARCVTLSIAVALLLSLSACEAKVDQGASVSGSPVLDPAPVPPPTGHVSLPMTAMQCDASKGQTAVGQRATPSVVDKVIADTGSRTARVIKPGQVVTMEYSDERVNLHVDTDNVITAVNCG